MILVDIQVPVLDRVYDFELDEGAEVEMLTEDILALISEQEHVTCKNSKEMLLYSLRQELILEGGSSLKQQGIIAGDRLILF